jgi:hypothetical protein
LFWECSGFHLGPLAQSRLWSESSLRNRNLAWARFGLSLARPVALSLVVKPCWVNRWPREHDVMTKCKRATSATRALISVHLKPTDSPLRNFCLMCPGPRLNASDHELSAIVTGHLPGWTWTYSHILQFLQDDSSVRTPRPYWSGRRKVDDANFSSQG